MAGELFSLGSMPELLGFMPWLLLLVAAPVSAPRSSLFIAIFGGKFAAVPSLVTAGFGRPGDGTAVPAFF